MSGVTNLTDMPARQAVFRPTAGVSMSVRFVHCAHVRLFAHFRFFCSDDFLCRKKEVSENWRN